MGLHAWGTKLFPTAVLAHPVDWTSTSPKLKAQQYCLSPNGCFSPPSVSHRPPSPTPIDSLCVILQELKKLSDKQATFK